MRNQLLFDNQYSYKENLWQGDSEIRDVEIWLSERLKKLIPQSSIFSQNKIGLNLNFDRPWREFSSANWPPIY